MTNYAAYCGFCPAYCCYKLPGSTLYIDAEDINRIARYFRLTDGEVRKRYIQDKNTFRTRPDGSCIFLTNGVFCKRCSIHTARPRQCMDFPYNSPCPYLHRDDLLEEIHPRVIDSLQMWSRFTWFFGYGESLYRRLPVFSFKRPLLRYTSVSPDFSLLL